MNDESPNPLERGPGPEQTPSEAAEDGLPGGLVDALRQATRDRASVFVPPALDDVILARARAHLTPITPRQTPVLLALRPWLAAAAGILFAAWLAQQIRMSGDSLGSRLVAEDIDHNGRVDILDAFNLARRIEGGTVTNAFDFNGDRQVDAADVDLLARRAVQLENKS